MKNTSADRSFLLAHISAVMAALIVGSPVILTSLAMETVQPLEATFVIYFFAFICLIPFCLIFCSKITIINPRDLTAISTLGILFCFIFSMTFNKGLQLTSASRGALIMSFIPTLTLIFGFFFTVEKMSINKVLGCIITFWEWQLVCQADLHKPCFQIVYYWVIAL